VINDLQLVWLQLSTESEYHSCSICSGFINSGYIRTSFVKSKLILCHTA